MASVRPGLDPRLGELNVLRAVLPPVIAAYAIFVLMVLSSRRRPVARQRAGATWLGTRRRGFMRYLAATTAGGYVVYLAIVAIFHAWLGAEPDALDQRSERRHVHRGFTHPPVHAIRAVIS
ncbi:MAG: hypothetical protein ACRDGO_10230 [Actinomycetota bacterium]